ncbi:MAG: ROK family protein, partial [Hyphomicrobiaceae bacterium]|nr:ROK family protein [Hyphomicrobiaceae bacterium]
MVPGRLCQISGASGAVLRLGIDLGGTKIAGIAVAPGGAVVARHRITTPRHDYAATLGAIGEMVGWLETAAGGRGTVGVGMPGSAAPVGDMVQNANSTWLNGRPFARDLEARLGRQVRLANDANCFALSEAIDGAAAGAPSVFGVILGTGCGGGLVFGGSLIDGPLGIAGEWGHNPLPWAA